MTQRSEVLWESFHHSDAGDLGHWIGGGPSNRRDRFQVSEGNEGKKVQ